eukprot:10486471-Ditylum_brightwellii.AAC.2
MDHASKLVYISNQVSLITTDTVVGKQDFEHFAGAHGVKINQYHGDNGVFKAKLWQDHCKTMG